MRGTLALQLLCVTFCLLGSAVVPLTGIHIVQAQEIEPGKTGAELRQSLREDFTSDGNLTYKQARKSMFTEIDNKSGVLRLVYTGSFFSTTVEPNHNIVNTEHTWPRSKFKDASNKSQMDADLHHLFPTWNKVNGARGSSPFGEVVDSETEKWWIDKTPAFLVPDQDIESYSESLPNLFEPREDHKGNVARAMLYFFTMYEERGIDVAWFLPQIPTLQAWHVADPVDDVEIARNQAIKAKQGNLNPFIVDPSLATRIFGFSNSDMGSLRGSTFDSLLDRSARGSQSDAAQTISSHSPLGLPIGKDICVTVSAGKVEGRLVALTEDGWLQIRERSSSKFTYVLAVGAIVRELD